jgi:PTH2 family peptidyl-tRNA hydrolase
MEALNHKQVIVLRKDLNMRKGKLVAQGAHASMAAILSQGQATDVGDTFTIQLDDRMKDWLLGSFKKITVSVNSEEELLSLYERAKGSGLICSLILDSGLTEFGGRPTYTAVAVGPDVAAKVDVLTGDLPLL